ncbi:DNA-3-methyladenine glycosylase family protein [Leeia aquatica]|uniref:DNA-3-methyladenine glycosylase II n=1 Tax=Leeia aquatica TaxID=2725557 RepID=A0A847SDD5_9NEIS|nr:DNA-3-methyladenine glycosylase 2 family protein [Leeia aquatica]NLR75329.1 DNA-3-methyladenine glycosylase 2 family protein [Leeia aquatica]
MSVAPRQKQAPSYWDEACAQLAQQDRALTGLLQAYPAERLQGGGDAFVTLANSIIGQQISVRAAEQIWGRLNQRVQPLTPEHVLATPADELKQVGLSTRKVEYLTDLARHFSDGRIESDQFDHLSDAEVIARLTDVRGIGRWTAEMFLIFHLLRQDVLPLDDIGLQRAVAQHYGWPYPFPLKQLDAFAERWRPWRTVATWYLWRSLDPIPVAY